MSDARNCPMRHGSWRCTCEDTCAALDLIEEEREECAKLAREIGTYENADTDTTEWIFSAIMARGKL